MTAILGISAFYHDSAACLIIDGEIISAVQEERFTRIKHDASYPKNAIESLLIQSNLNLSDIDFVVFYEKPLLKFERLLETYLVNAPKGFRSFRMAMPVWLREKLFLKYQLTTKLKLLDKNFDENKLYFPEHHFSHAASAFYPSPFEEAVVLTLDGVGEWATTTVGIGRANKLEILKEIHFPDSIGLLYSAITYYLGFRVNSGEYKVMGLAPYGESKYKDLILNNLIDLKDDGSFKLNQEYFNYAAGTTMVNEKFCNLFGEPVRESENSLLTQFHMDMAASIQEVIEEIVLKISFYLKKTYQIENLCLAGGVALNCVANGKILREKIFKDIWIQPAAGDAGGALGGALGLWYQELNNERVVLPKKDSMKGSYLGPKFSDQEIERELINLKANYDHLSEDQMIEKTSLALLNGEAVGWFQGRMEFGPRALGGRSILGDPRSEQMQKLLNLKVKFRESFRPFAPSILREDLNKWFKLNCDSPYMLLVDEIDEDLKLEMSIDQKKLFGIDKLNIKRSEIPAVTHVDYSARIQTVHEETNPIYHKLLTAFKKKTNCPVLVNTSFNVRGEPIVGSPSDAFKCFMGTDMEFLAIGNFVLRKDDQKESLKENYKDKYELD
tara:strand:+ start:5691 stop:7529 length:1839 start_codon:yes stop_codon:yes gene_type:complete